MAEFEIDPRILAASEPVASLKLCDARLQNDARWPWLVLVPRRVGAREYEHLSPADRPLLGEEMAAAGAAVRAVGAALGRPVEKLNLCAIGNVVPQLHLHVTGRRPDDHGWPGPAWGLPAPEPYAPDRLAAALEAARVALHGVLHKR